MEDEKTAGTIVKPHCIAGTEILRAGPNDGKPVIFLTFEAADDEVTEPILLYFDDAESLARTILKAIDGERLKRSICNGPL